jgi:hypothetical protein
VVAGLGLHRGVRRCGACMNGNPMFHPDQLRLDVDTTLLSRPSRKTPRHKAGQKFLKGPIPLDWLSMAAKQPGKAFHVAIALWFWVGLRKSCEVAFSMSWLEATFGVDRFSGYRGLAALEGVGLVLVVRHRGRKPMVTLLDTPPGR